ncbi:MAG: lytic transglycosylase domain-containing protein [Gammaproteobacteria bacterium]|nr:lytic transglycosylase domain-containing protein [Gammaproteobacteria bacterium]
MQRCVTSRIGFVCALVCGLIALPVHADIYKFVDKYGRVYLTDRPDHEGYKLLIRTWKGWEEQSYAKAEQNRRLFAPSIANAAKKNQLPHTLVHAVVTAESAYNPNAVSKAGAVGLMQLMPETAKRYHVANRRDPVANLRGGTAYLRDLLTLFDNNLVLALAAYNAGENAVIAHGKKIPPYAETQRYIARVLDYYREYRSKL